MVAQKRGDVGRLDFMIATIFIIRGTDEKAGVESRTYSHVKDARTQKKASGRNCSQIEKDRGGDATKGF
jgi:hypothetical protein